MREVSTVTGSGGSQQGRGFNLFSREALGGWHASFIESQDSVAAFLALEAISGEADRRLKDVQKQNARIICEWQDDLELQWEGGRLYLQVKDQELTVPNIKSICSKFGDILASDASLDGVARFRIVALGGLHKSARHLPQHLMQLQSASEIRTDLERAQLISDFVRRWDLPERVALSLSIDTRDLRRDSLVAYDLFAASLRRALPVHDFTDRRVHQLYRELAGDVFSAARRHRTWVSLIEARNRLLTQFMPLHLTSYEIEYVRTDFGYLKDPQRREQIKAEEQLVEQARRQAYRRWIRHTRGDRLLDLLLRGPIKCLACNHPLMANVLGRGGIACPDCSYQPYLTLVYICDCAELMVVDRQPEVDRVHMFGSAISWMRSSPTCGACGASPAFEKLPTRLGMVPFPVPVEEYSPAKLIGLRERLGWTTRGWRGSPNGPVAEMLRTRHAEAPGGSDASEGTREVR
jgi:hypothetical protein